MNDWDWREVNDDTPRERVLLYFPRRLGKVDLAEMIEVGLARSYPHRKPTHWQPLPRPPRPFNPGGGAQGVSL